MKVIYLLIIMHLPHSLSFSKLYSSERRTQIFILMLHLCAKREKWHFFVLCPFRTWVFMTFHNLLSFVAFSSMSFCYFSTSCSAIHLHKLKWLVSAGFLLPLIYHVSVKISKPSFLIMSPRNWICLFLILSISNILFFYDRTCIKTGPLWQDVMFSKFALQDKLQLNSKLNAHWRIHTFCLVPHPSYA